jgi:threonyl-tRNA synthetase
MAAVLTEHWGGKWPFWLSPRQCIGTNSALYPIHTHTYTCTHTLYPVPCTLYPVPYTISYTLSIIISFSLFLSPIPYTPIHLYTIHHAVVPIDLKFADYACTVQTAVHDAGYYVDVDDSARTLNKKVREAQLSQYNFILVVGQKEMEEGSVNVRTRENEVKGTMPLASLIAHFKTLAETYDINC